MVYGFKQLLLEHSARCELISVQSKIFPSFYRARRRRKLASEHYGDTTPVTVACYFFLFFAYRVHAARWRRCVLFSMMKSKFLLSLCSIIAVSGTLFQRTQSSRIR